MGPIHTIISLIRSIAGPDQRPGRSASPACRPLRPHSRLGFAEIRIARPPSQAAVDAAHPEFPTRVCTGEIRIARPPSAARPPSTPPIQVQVVMACLFRFGQKLKLRVRGRELSTGTCVIKGFYQDVVFPDWNWESLSAHAAKYPLVSSVRGRLIKVDECYPLKINDHWRKLLFTAFLHSFLCKQQGDYIYNSYDLRNIGVIKLRRSNIFGFKRFERISGMTNTDHEGFISFVHNLFAEFCGPSVLQQVRDLSSFLGMLSASSYSSSLSEVCDSSHFPDGLPDISMLCSPVFLSDEEMASFYVDAHRLVRHEFPMRNAGHKAHRILKNMELFYWKNDCCVKACKESLLVKHLLGRHEKTAEGIKLYKEPKRGSAVVDIPRISVTHCIEMDVLNKARRECTSSSDLNLLDNFSRAEAIEGIRHMFPLYPQAMVCSFLANREWPQLKMEERLPLPSIYAYHSPWQ